MNKPKNKDKAPSPPKAPLPMWRITHRPTGEVREVRRNSVLNAVTVQCGWYLDDCDWERVKEKPPI